MPRPKSLVLAPPVSLLLFTLTAVSVLATPPAATSETITAPFTLAAGTPTLNSYFGLVHIQVSGTGTAYFSNETDAFYETFTQTERASSSGDFQLAIGTPDHPLIGESDGQGGRTDAIKFDIVSIDGIGAVTSGTIPAYSPTNMYGFTILVPNSTSTPLRFGVNDGGYGDNTGAFTITVTQVPEPSSLFATLGGGFALLTARNAVAAEAR